MKKLKDLFSTPMQNTLLMSSLMLALTTGCKKTETDSKPTSAQSPASINVQALARTSDTAALSQNISTFYANMKAFVDGEDLSLEPTLTADSAEFIIEATYNREAVSPDFGYDHSVKYVTFEVIQSASGVGGTINQNDIATAFWQIKDSLMATYNSISYSEKELSMFDLTVTTQTGVAKFVVTGGITTAKISFYNPGCNFTFTDGPSGNKCYNVSDVAQASGQGIFNHTTGAVGSVTSGPTAPDLLRVYGLYKTLCNSSAACGYWVNVATTNTVGGTILSSPTSDYVSRGINDYANQDIWGTYVRLCGNNGPTCDPQVNYKYWLNTQMMNFYLARIPHYATTSVPSGKQLLDMKVNYMAPLGGSIPDPNDPFVYLLARYYEYQFRHGIFIRTSCRAVPGLVLF